MAADEQQLITASKVIAADVLLLGLSLAARGDDSNVPDPAARPVAINTTTGWSDSPCNSGGGQRPCFTYSRYNFWSWIISGSTVAPLLSGPDRPGLHHRGTNPFDESDIYMATYNPGGSRANATPVDQILTEAKLI